MKAWIHYDNGGKWHAYPRPETMLQLLRIAYDALDYGAQSATAKVSIGEFENIRRMVDANPNQSIWLDGRVLYSAHGALILEIE